jgi:hypothetical protein
MNDRRPTELFSRAGDGEAYATRLNPMGRRPTCDACLTRPAWWAMRDRRCLCSTCLTTEETVAGLVLESRPAATWGTF